MRVNNQNLTGAAAAEPGRAQETQKSVGGDAVRQGASGTGGSSDRVELSSTLGSLSRALAAFGSDRAGQVQALAVQYQSGSYQPDSAYTSQGMIAEALSAGIG